ncbi:MAG: hypothetical protein U1E76_22810 [Planctomycetota bacterium]
MLSFEFEPPDRMARCPCCGGSTTSLTRFVYQDGHAHGVYYARFANHHPVRHVLATVSLGAWGAGSTPSQRVAFALELRPGESQYQVGVVDAARSPWSSAKVIGRTLDRSEALEHPLLPEVFHITDHMVVEDEPLKAYLDGE